MFKDKLKSMILKKENTESSEKSETKGIDGNNKKKIENMVFLIIILIVTVVIINYIWNGEKNSDKTITNSAGKKLATIENTQTKTQSQNQSQNKTTNEINNSLEQRLEAILSNISGVGDVKVFINYSESSETVAMYNENSKTSVTEETDTSGGVRKVKESNSQKDIVYQENNGSKVPIVQKTVEPKIEGAIITAKGAKDINIKTSIIQAVEAATGLATHKIQVFEMTQ